MRLQPGLHRPRDILRHESRRAFRPGPGRCPVPPVAGASARGKLGFTVEVTADRSLLDARLQRIVVTGVASASPAERAGMKVGDVLDRLNGEPVVGGSGRKFFAAMGKVKPGDRLDLVVLRGDRPVPLTLVAE